MGFYFCCATIEGFYCVRPSEMNPYSSYHLSFNLGYPNKYDRSLDRTGSAVMIHGSNMSTGCLVMTERVMEYIYALADSALRNVQKFVRVQILPFRMTNANMKRYADSDWRAFWENLKKGYDISE